MPAPQRGPAGYKFPTDSEHLRDWAVEEARLEGARFYWLATTLPTHAPYVRPLWGVWVERAFYFDGHPRSRWARNIAADHRASIHLDGGGDALIVEGIAEDLDRVEPALGREIVAAWSEKYGRLLPDPASTGIFRLRPTRARAWSETLVDATVWTFPDDA